MLVRDGKLKYILRPGTKVRVDHRGVFSAAKEPQWHDARVVETLSTQFTAEMEGNEVLVFRFYRDINGTWEPLEESL